jgi:phospholipid/cholesterol/gamma-HCH transport system substrate-binding protein
MATSKNRRGIIVGIFIVIGLGLLVAIILVMGGQRKTFSTSITISAVFNEISGLQEGNNVWLSGVKVGTVRKISFTPDSKVQVRMSVLESMQPYIHKDAKAKVGSESLIGNKIIVLTGGSPHAPSVEDGDVVGTIVPLNTDEMLNTLQTNNQNLLSITSDLKTLTARLNAGEGSVGKLLHDETLVNTLQATLNRLNAAAAHANTLTSDISAYTAKLQAKGTLANDLVTDTVVFRRIRQTAIQLQEIGQTVQQVTDNLNKASNSINNSLGSSSTPLGVLLNDPAVAADLKGTFTNLNSGSKKLDEDLEALQHNFLLRGFFKKKEKAKADSMKTKTKN